MRKKILFITESLPFPPDSGSHIKTFNTLKTLGKNFDIFLFCLTEKKPSASQIRELKKVVSGISLFVNPQISFSLKKHPFFVVKNYLQGRPYLFFQYYHPEVNLKIEEIIQTFKPQIIHIDHFSMAQFLPKEKKQTWVLDCHNFESDVTLKYSKQSSSIFRRVFYNLETYLRKKLEKRLFPLFDHIFVLSRDEKEKVKKVSPNVPVDIQKMSYTSLPIFRTSGGKNRNKNFILFVGGLDWFPNFDAITWFINKIFPKLLIKNSDLELHIVGRKPSQLLPHSKNVFFHGYQPNLEEYFQKATVFIVPIRIASGIRVKILTSIANKVPVISTTEGMTGLSDSEKACLIASTDQDFIEKTSYLLSNKKGRDALVKNATKYLHNEFPKSSNQLFLSTYKKIVR